MPDKLPFLLLGQSQLVVNRILVDVVVLREKLLVHIRQPLLVYLELLPCHRVEDGVPGEQHEQNGEAE